MTFKPIYLNMSAKSWFNNDELSGDAYRANIESIERLLESQCVFIPIQDDDWPNIIDWIRERAIQIDSIPTPFSKIYTDLSNTWAWRDHGRSATIWIENDEIRMQFQLTWL